MGTASAANHRHVHPLPPGAFFGHVGSKDLGYRDTEDERAYEDAAPEDVNDDAAGGG